MEDAIQALRRSLYALKMPCGLVLSKKDHESAHVTSNDKVSTDAAVLASSPGTPSGGRSWSRLPSLQSIKAAALSPEPAGISSCSTGSSLAPRRAEGLWYRTPHILHHAPCLPDTCLARTRAHHVLQVLEKLPATDEE